MLRSPPLSKLLLEGRAFFNWWFKTLQELLPGPVRRRLFPQRKLLLTLSEGGERLHFWRFEDGELRSLGELAGKELSFWRDRLPPPLRSWPIELLLSPHDCLITTIQLPAAAAENLRQVLAFEIDHYTPWTADQAAFAFRIQDYRGDKVQVELIALPRRRLDDLLDLLQALEIFPQRVDVARSEQVENFSTFPHEKDQRVNGARSEPNRSYGVDLLPQERRTKRSLFATGWLPQLFLLLGGILLALAMPIVAQKRLQEALTQQVEALLPRADRSLKLKRHVLEQRRLLSQMAEAIASQPPLTLLLEDLARKLPRSTHITQLRYRRSEQTLYLSGLSDRAAELISILEASPYLESLQFTTAITRDRSGKERFQLRAKVVVPKENRSAG